MSTITINTEKMNSIGQNVRVVEQDGVIILVIDPKVDLGLSSTGKMRGVANTSGFTFLTPELKGNIYIGRKV